MSSKHRFRIQVGQFSQLCLDSSLTWPNACFIYLNGKRLTHTVVRFCVWSSDPSFEINKTNCTHKRSEYTLEFMPYVHSLDQSLSKSGPCHNIFVWVKFIHIQYIEYIARYIPEGGSWRKWANLLQYIPVMQHRLMIEVWRKIKSPNQSWSLLTGC